jgi:hypothetical protein
MVNAAGAGREKGQYPDRRPCKLLRRGKKSLEHSAKKWPFQAQVHARKLLK